MILSIITFLLIIAGAVIDHFVHKKWLRHVGFFLVIVCAVLSLISACQSDGALKRTQISLDNVKKYSVVATYDFTGIATAPGPGLYVTNRLYNLLTPTYVDDNGSYKFRCGEEYEKIYQAVISEYPEFPFSYYFLADCKKQRNEDDWKNYARSALEIFNITTTIGGHKERHDEVKKVLTEYLDSK